MSSKTDNSILSRCLVIVLKEKRGKREEVKEPSVNKTRGGQELFEDFVAENRACYWNPHLEESIKGLKYVGYLLPSTLLVGGRDIFLDTLRGAWGRKALRPPLNFSIVKVGELSGLDLDPIPQAQFTPLPEALCQIISDINKKVTSLKDHGHGWGVRVGASLDAILDKLQEKYRGVQQPPEQIVYETLESLMKERKIYHTGSGYSIVTPDTFQLNQLNGCVSVQDNHLVIEGGSSPIFIPLPLASMQSSSPGSPSLRPPPPSASEHVSISCQTDEKEVGQSPDDGKSSKLDRSFSFRDSSGKTGKAGGKESQNAEFSRSSSMRYSPDKAQAVVKDINLKTSDLHQDKDKGEKTSLLNKLFGRNKSKRSSSANRPPISETEDIAEVRPEKEYATFSAQFPPPEWQWYDQYGGSAPVSQQVTALGSPPPRKSHTWHYQQGAPRFYQDAETQSVLDENQSDDLEDVYECPIHKANTFPLGMPPPSFHQPGCNPYTEDPSQLYDRSQPISSSYSHDSHNSQEASFEAEDTRGKKSRHGHKSSKRRESPQPVMLRHQSLDEEPEEKHNEHFHRDFDVRPKACHNSSRQDHQDRSLDTSGYLRISEEPSFKSDLNDPLADPVLNNAQQEKIERPTHVSRVFKKYREMKCGSFLSNDINVEYQGRLSQKRVSQFAKSRDSGVNCIGLAKHQGEPDNQCLETDMKKTNEVKPCNLSPDVQAKNSSAKTPVANGVLHDVLVHRSPENMHEDSGFNSPRTNGLPASHFYGSPEMRNPQDSNTNSQQNQDASYEMLPHQDSDQSRNSSARENSMWSDSSKHTVLENALQTQWNGQRSSTPNPNLNQNWAREAEDVMGYSSRSKASSHKPNGAKQDVKPKARASHHQHHHHRKSRDSYAEAPKHGRPYTETARIVDMYDQNIGAKSQHKTYDVVGMV